MLPVAQWLEHPNYNSGDREFDSHLELGIFSELSGVRILRRPNYIVFVSKFCYWNSLFWLSLLVVEIVIICFAKMILGFFCWTYQSRHP